MKSPIEQITVKLRCDNENATGFFVTDEILLTAYHTFINCQENTKIEVYIDGECFEASIVDTDKLLDVALLRVNYTFNARLLPLEASAIRIGEKWESFGFPYNIENTGVRYVGKAHQIVSNALWDYLLSCDGIQPDYNYAGLSGSPIVLFDKVCAVILVQQNNKLGVISIKKIEQFLLKNGIDISQPYDNITIPEGLKDEIAGATPNFEVFDEIDKVLHEQYGWVLLHGSPGSGKTTIAATYIPENENISVIGRYFLKVPQDTMSSTVRSSKRKFIEWIEELAYRTIGEILPPQTNLEEKEKQIPYMIQMLSYHLESIGKTGVVIIDGLDELLNSGENSLFDFLGIIPLTLPANLRIIISCTSKDILPPQIKEFLHQEQEVHVEPLDMAQCENYIKQRTKELSLPYVLIQELARKSEGHPLYLNYLINYLLNEYSLSDAEEQINVWIQSIPVIGGNITNYYNSIWDKISTNAGLLAIVATLSQTRGLAREVDLIQMLEKAYQIAFYTHIKSLLYLINHTENKEYEIYHSSFSKYIEDNISTPILSALHDNIITFCIANKNSKYAIWNHLFHLSKCSDKQKCIEQCSQDWADKCALNDVYPELVLIDIKNTINIAIDFEKTTEVIRLLLLSQRIEFRYDSVFAENAFELAEAMIALKKPEAAYNYLVRENTVLTTESDSIYFLQLLYENEYKEIAYKFYQNIDAKQREAFFNKEGISSQVFLTRLYAQTQLCHEGKIGFERFQNLMGTLGDFEKVLEKEGKDAFLGIRFVREYGLADNNAFFIRNYDQYVPIEQMLSHRNLSVDIQAIRILALTLLKYDEINNGFNYIGKNDSFYRAINDISSLIQKHIFDYTEEDLYLILLSIIADCKDSSIISHLINKYSPQYNKLNVRKENGVDVDFQILFHYNNLNIFRGYIDEDNSYSVFSNKPNRIKQWEGYLETIIERIAFIRGKIYRCKADNINNLDTIYNQLTNTLYRIDFTFDERSHWDRSYQIPEMIFPYIYTQIAQLYIYFFQDKISDFSNHLKNRSEYQLCLFTEGFRKSLFDIISLFIKHKAFRDDTFDLLNILENHILKGVQNRWERTPELIKLVKLYALFENKDKAMDVFQKMLDTSMGPSWYKEDQLALINRAAKLGNSLEKKQICEYATLLDLASGEMTFQRYVRVEKEEFIGALAKREMINEAIEYYKYETLPPPNIIIQNAESNTIDMPRKGDGYVLGARSIIEAHGILTLLHNSKSISPIVKCALSEIYFDNDDNFRYIDSFAKLHTEILNNIDPELCDTVIERLSRYLIDNISAESDKKEYLSNIQKSTSEDIVRKIQGYLLKRGYSWNIEVENRESNDYQDNGYDRFAEACDFYEKNFQNTGREIVLQKITNAFRENRVSVWFGNYSQKHSLLREYLKEFLFTDHEALKLLRNEIVNADSVKWVVVSELLWLLEHKISEHAKDLQSIISEHFALLIRPEADSFKKYEWLELKTPDYSSDKKTIEFIIWFLNHPNDTIRDRAEDVLVWLGELNYTSTITSLIEESLSDKPISSVQQCSFILKKISKNNPGYIHQTLMSDKSIEERIIQIKHFTIFRNYLDISIDLVKIGYSELHVELKKQIPKARIITGEVILEDDYLIPIEDEIEYFNEMQILNREFCNTLKYKVLDYCNPLLPIHFATSDRYLIRSFYDDTYYRGRYPELLNHALNHAIMCRVDEGNINEIYNYLN